MRMLIAVGCLAAVITVAPPAASAGPVPVTAPAAADSARRCPTPTPSELGTFFDAAVPAGLTANRVPGLVVSVVAGGTTAFAQGYGLADVERGVAFDADRSLVRIASITKLFTWTAVMQQVEAGRLDLDADVNQYLTGSRFRRPCGAGDAAGPDEPHGWV